MQSIYHGNLARSCCILFVVLATFEACGCYAAQSAGQHVSKPSHVNRAIRRRPPIMKSSRMFGEGKYDRGRWTRYIRGHKMDSFWRQVLPTNPCNQFLANAVQRLPFYIPSIPEHQPKQCPVGSGGGKSMLQGDTGNLETSCPWIYRLLDLGVNALPRFVKEAQCLCENCLGVSGMKCQHMYQDFHYAKIKCTGRGFYGYPPMETKHERKLVVGCYCAYPDY